MKFGSVLAIGGILSVATVASANGNYLYGYAVGAFNCYTEYSGTTYIRVMTNVFEYCPYGGNAFNGSGFAQNEVGGNMYNWARMSCSGDLSNGNPYWQGAFSDPQAAYNSQNTWCSNGQNCQHYTVSVYVPNVCNP
jgi:hypothetical protein